VIYTVELFVSCGCGRAHVSKELTKVVMVIAPDVVPGAAAVTQ
jgi:hypothetical protein